MIYFVLSRIALPRIANVLAERQGTITNDIAAAEELKVKFGSALASENREEEVVAIPGLRGRPPKEITQLEKEQQERHRGREEALTIADSVAEKAFAEMARRHKATLYVDDAHGLGVLGAALTADGVADTGETR